MGAVDADHPHKAPIDRLVMMANQIAQFFKSYPHDQAVAGVAHHIEAYWTPKMRRAFDEGMVEAKGLDPLVLDALSPKMQAKSPIEKAAAGPGKVGDLGAVDAG